MKMPTITSLRWIGRSTTFLLLSGILAAQTPHTQLNLAQSSMAVAATTQLADNSPALPPSQNQTESKEAATPTNPSQQGPTASTTHSESEHPDQEFDKHTLHVVVGRSIFVNTVDRMRRVYVSNPAAIETVTPTPRDLVITAKAAGTSTVILWSESGTATVYTVLADLDVAGLTESLAQALPGTHISVGSQQGKVFLSGVVGNSASFDAATKLASIYSKDVLNSIVVDQGHLPQVKLKVRFAELDRSKLNQFGINLLFLGNNTGSSTTGQYGSQTFNKIGGGDAASAVVSDVMNLFYFNFTHGLGLTIKDLQDKGILEILAEPDLVTINGQTAKFLAGGEFPFPMIQPGSGGGTATVTIQFRPYGVKLEFTPYVNPDGTIRLKVAPEVSALDYTNVVVISGYTIPSLSTRHIETEIEVKDGQSFGISGILDHRTTDSFSKMPGIGDIPVLGQLFRSKSQNHSIMELIVVVTPTVVNPLADDAPAPPNPTWVVPPGQIAPFSKDLPKGYDQK